MAVLFHSWVPSLSPVERHVSYPIEHLIERTATSAKKSNLILTLLGNSNHVSEKECVFYYNTNFDNIDASVDGKVGTPQNSLNKFSPIRK